MDSEQPAGGQSPKPPRPAADSPAASILGLSRTAAPSLATPPPTAPSLVFLSLATPSVGAQSPEDSLSAVQSPKISMKPVAAGHLTGRPGTPTGTPTRFNAGSIGGPPTRQPPGLAFFKVITCDGKGRLSRWAAPLTLMATLGIGWEGLVRMMEIPRYILPAPSLVLETLWRKWPLFALHTGVTLQEVAAGGALGILIGITLGVLMFFFLPLERALYPLLITSQNVPVFAIAPLLVVWFGYGFLPKVLMAAIIVFFPITVATLDGLKRTDPDYVRLFRTLGATGGQILWKLRFPAALPAIFSGLKISALYATIGAVIGEWVGAGAGLGYLMLSANAQLRVAEVFGAILCLTPIGLLLLGVVTLAERLLMPWQRLTPRKPPGAE